MIDASPVANLDHWLDTMRTPAGYGGPVVHWWRNSLHFTGAGLDWRYEGIIHGYLALYRKTGDARWLSKARQAGKDLLHGQMPNANFQDSCFELNPYPGGTPHEAACDLALLALAEELRTDSDPAWRCYYDAAEQNITGYYLRVLWDPDAQMFRDDPDVSGFVPNKSATLSQALCALATLSGDGRYVEQYALPIWEAILRHQIRKGPLQGAIYQYSANDRPAPWFFPLYIARCVPGLLAGYEWTGDERYLEAAHAAMRFVMAHRYEDGSFPQVIYPAGRINRYPQWIAAVGDILRVLTLLSPYGFDADPLPTVDWLFIGILSSGGIRTAWGFASQGSQHDPGAVPAFQDLLPVAGWASMAFRYLAECLPDGVVLPTPAVSSLEIACTVRGENGVFVETESQMELRIGKRAIYHWRKGTTWADICTPVWFWK